jgi:hypothetical protein
MPKLRTSLAAAAVALAMSVSAGPAHAGNGKDLLKALPKDGAGVVVVNVEQLARSPLFQELYKMATGNPQAQMGMAELTKSLGMDPLAAVKTIVVGLPKGLGGQGLVLLTLGADAKKVEALATQAGMTAKAPLQGATMLQAPDGATLALLGNQVFMGQEAQVKAGLGSLKGKGGSLEKNAEVMKLVGGANQGDDLWFAANLAGQTGELAHAKSARGGVDLEKGVKLHAVVTMDSAAEATKFVTETKAKMDELKAQPQAKMLALDAVAGKLALSAKGTDVTVDLPLDEADVNRLKTAVGMMMMMAGAAGGAPGAMPGGPAGMPLQMPAPPAQPR